jgi:hypothetical protein
MRIHLLVEHALELEAAHSFFERLGVVLDGTRGSFVVLALGQLEQLCGVSNSLARPIYLVYCRREACALTSELLSPLLIGPDAGLLELASNLFEPLLLLVVFKETPEGQRYAPRDPSAGA